MCEHEHQPTVGVVAGSTRVTGRGRIGAILIHFDLLQLQV
jgi:hypothetical protein